MIIIYNPAAGHRRAARLWRVLDILNHSGVRVELVETCHPGHATSLAREAAREQRQGSAPLVVAAGGDGTIAEVARGLAGSDVKLGIIPLGTANVLARELDLSFSPSAVAAALAFGRTRALWPGIATGASGERLFVQMLGVGLDAQVVHRLPKPLKRVLGRGAYVIQTLREMVRYDYAPILVRIDGQETEAGSVIVTKGTLYGGHYLLAPEARPDEPGFVVALFRRSGPWSAMMYGAALPLNLLPCTPGLSLVRATRVEICGSASGVGHLSAQADGDPAGGVPISIRNAERPIRVIIA